MFLYRREEDFSDLGKQVMARARELIHEAHLSGQFDPSLQDALQRAQKEISQQIAKRAKSYLGGKNGKRTNNGTD